MNFTVNGKTHRMLSRLEEGDCGFSTLLALCHPNGAAPKHLRKLGFHLRDLMSAGLIAHDGRAYFILPAGEDELAALEAQAPRSIRVFPLARAA